MADRRRPGRGHRLFQPGHDVDRPETVRPAHGPQIAIKQRRSGCFGNRHGGQINITRGHFEIIGGLHVEPGLRAGAEKLAEPQRGRRGDGLFLVQMS